MDGARERFKVSFVEFDDQGSFWSRQQLTTLEAELLKASESPGHEGVLTVVFVHGWQHNAAVCDQNVACFRDILESLANAEDYRVHALTNANPDVEILPRYVFGVYVGWRGLSNRLPGLKNATFYNRKATAHRVGRGDVLELFTRLEVWRDRLHESGRIDSKLVIIGHSFGGAVTYTALSKVLHERLARAVARKRDDAAVVEPIRGFGDLVVLVNPAFEAARYSGIHELASGIDEFAENQPAVLVTVSSDTDTATHLAFPVGRWLGTRFLKTRDDQQAKSLTTTVGNFEPFRTHRLDLGTSEDFRGDFLELADLHELDAAARGADDCKCDYFEAEVKDAEQEDPFGEFRIGPAQGIYGETKLTPKRGVAAETPFIIATTSDEIVTNHNGIYNRYFLNFLRSFLLEMDRRTSASRADMVEEPDA